MADYFGSFDGLKFSEVKHHGTKDVLEEGDIKEGEGYCGVVHVHDIVWDKKYGFVDRAKVELYCTSFEETNVLSTKSGSTDHRVMMEGLSLWKKFEGLKLRACDKDGYLICNIAVHLFMSLDTDQRRGSRKIRTSNS